MKGNIDKKVVTTSIEYAILGLLNQQPLSGYGIRKIFETTALGKFSTSPGTIYPALKRLQNRELVSRDLDTATNKSKFKITQNGVSILSKWIVKEVELNDVEKGVDLLLLKFAFMPTIATQEQTELFLISFREALIIHISGLEKYHNTSGKTDSIHAKLAFEHGIQSYKTTLKWCKRALTIIQKNSRNEK